MGLFKTTRHSVTWITRRGTQREVNKIIATKDPNKCADFARRLDKRFYEYQTVDLTKLRAIALNTKHMNNVWNYVSLATIAPQLEQQDFAILKKLETMTIKEYPHFNFIDVAYEYLQAVDCQNTSGLVKIILDYENHSPFSYNEYGFMRIMQKLKTKEDIAALQKCLQSRCASCNKQFQYSYFNGMETFFKMLYEVPNLDPNLALDFITYEAGNQFNLIEDTLCILTSNDPMKDYKVNNLPKQVTPEQIEMLKACRHRNLKNFLIVRNLDNFILSENTSYENTLLYLDGATKEMKDYELYKFEEKLNNSHSQQIVADFSKIVKNPNDEVLSR